MKRLLIIIFAFFSLALLLYLALPGQDFPPQPPDSVQSKEPADTENQLRRAYFTNFSRQEVLSWYESEFNHTLFKGLHLPTYLLNYPPEEAGTIIRDQTRSSYLQEVVHPLRESIYINGFDPKDAKDAININGTSWREKITVRFVPSNIFLREGLAIASLILLLLLMREWYFTIKGAKKLIP